jgi:hypothetical protein
MHQMQHAMIRHCHAMSVAVMNEHAMLPPCKKKRMDLFHTINQATSKLAG